ncbi:MAG: methionyl-tRNA formyltransferase [Chitinophagia bacterium]|nr:methionyl-tRNA formyltransferase [Chitinophagia bacterium]
MPLLSLDKFKELRIVFLGTPAFAVGCLDALMQAGANIIAVVTAPDKPAGRGQQLHQSEVKQYAIAHNLPIMQPEKLKDPNFLATLAALKADIQIVVAFRMLPEAVWNMPPMGTLNVHGSLLPQYRGAAPINKAIRNGDTYTGVTTFKLKHEIDTGDILLQQQVDILPEDNAGTLHDKLMHAGAQLLVKTVQLLASGEIEEQPQASLPEAQLMYAHKITKADTQIDWNTNCLSIHNLIRSLSPYPAAITHLDGKILKVYHSHFTIVTDNHALPGAVETDHKSYLRYACHDGWVYLNDIQLEGKKRMDIVSFLRGYRKP